MSALTLHVELPARRHVPPRGRTVIGLDVLAVPCRACRSPAGYPCALAPWNRRHEHADRFGRAWRLREKGT